MVTSIVAITVVQVYWISTAWENKEEEFSLAVSQSLQSVSVKVQEGPYKALKGPIRLPRAL